MRFRVQNDVFQRFPTVCIGLVVAQGVRNQHPAARITALLREAEDAAKRRFAAHSVPTDPAIAAWRHAFTALGISSSRYKTSVEALVTRAVKGGPVPDLNAAVDLANAVSLTYLLPIGAHDLARVHGDLAVGPARSGALFTPIGHLEPEVVEAGEYVYADAQEVRTRRWVWRQSDHSKVLAHTDAILFPIDGWVGITDLAVRAAQVDLVRYLESELGAQTRTFFLDRAHPEAIILEDIGLADRAVAAAGGFRMSGTAYLEKPASPAAPGFASTPISSAPSSVAARGARADDLDAVGGLLVRGTVDVVVRDEVEGRLRRGDRLRVKFGIDPTSPQVHLGHAVVLRKLRAFQEQGHTICLVIGDFTAQIGDASDKSSMRQMLSEEQVLGNLATYRKQIARILDEKKVEWTYNSDWLGPLRFTDIVGLAANFTVAQMLERENFTNRYAAGQPIGLQEFLYPLMQGYDSVALKADLELGGTEQLFNLLAGRRLQAAYNQRPQGVITLALLMGLDGKKMSKSSGNCIYIEDPAPDMYGKIMSMADDQILPYFELCTEVSPAELAAIEAELASGSNPMGLKKRLAYTITLLYHGAAQAKKAQEHFEVTVQGRGEPPPEEVEEVLLARGGAWILVELLVTLGLAPSKSEARRKIAEGAVVVDGEKFNDPAQPIAVRTDMIVKLGKRGRKRIRLPT